MSCELTILMPCLNEEKTLEKCIKKAEKFLIDNNINGEILIADNNSHDNSREIALKNGTRLIIVEKKGYGCALRAGIKNANGRFIIVGDADDSYDFLKMESFIEKFSEGYELVMGNRFKGEIEKGAMPFMNRYIGNPILSYIGKRMYKCSINDFHCGLRGFNRESILNLNLECDGMEFASEMIIKAQINKLKMTEVPINLYKDGRNSKSNLRPLRDGIRHLKILFNYRKAL